MTKKIKLILGITSLVSTLAIVPATVISCGANTTNSNIINSVDETIVKLNAAALTQLYIQGNLGMEVIAIAKLLPLYSPNLLPLTKYFDTSLITSIATSNGVSATYSAMTQQNPAIC